MPVPLPKKITDLVGLQVYWQENAGDEPVAATVVDARWSATALRLRDGSERAGVEFLLDPGTGTMHWSMPYPEPNPEPEPEDSDDP